MVIKKRYVVIESIGRGGMAEVHRAYDPNDKREVAIKMIKLDLLDRSGARQRFEREVEVMMSLKHPAIVRIYDCGEENGQPYLVMALMEGGSLTDYLRKYRTLSPNDAARLIEHLAPGLDMIHQNNIVHRDLKPSNILFDQQKNPHIADFGIAKLLIEGMTSLTQTGDSIGTPLYMSPEQHRGENDIDGRSDIYSLGVILFQILTGQRPISGNFQALLKKDIYDADLLAIKPRLPQDCKTVIETAMAKDRYNRYATASEMAVAFRAAVEGKLVRPTKPKAFPLPPSFIDFFKYSLR